MRQAVIQNTLFCVALFVLGPLAWLAVRGLIDADGGHGTTLLHNSSIVRAVIGGLIVLAIAMVAGLLGGRLVSIKGALLDAGVVLAWGAGGLGSALSVARVYGGGTGVAGAFKLMSIEAAALGVVGAAMVIVLARFAKHEPRHDEHARSNPWGGLALAVAGAAIGVWLVAQSMLKGQAIGAAMVGGIGAGICAFFTGRNTPAWVPVAGVMLVGALGLWAATMMLPGVKLGEAVISGKVIAFGRLTPMDYLAGAFIGTPIGMSFGQWMGGWAHHSAGAAGGIAR